MIKRSSFELGTLQNWPAATEQRLRHQQNTELEPCYPSQNTEPYCRVQHLLYCTAPLYTRLQL